MFVIKRTNLEVKGNIQDCFYCPSLYFLQLEISPSHHHMLLYKNGVSVGGIFDNLKELETNAHGPRIAVFL